MNHVRFEKVKDKERKAKGSMMNDPHGNSSVNQEKFQAALEKHQLVPKSTPKKENKLNAFRNKMKAKVKNSNQTIISLGPNVQEQTMVQPKKDAPVSNKADEIILNLSSGTPLVSKKEIQMHKKKTSGLQKVLNKVRRSRNVGDSDDGDDGDKDCDFDGKRSGDEGLNSNDENGLNDSNDFGSQSEVDASDDENDSQIEGDANNIQKTLKNLYKNPMANKAPIEEEEAGDAQNDSSDGGSESLGSEFYDSDNVADQNKAGDKRTFSQAQKGKNQVGAGMSNQPNKR